MGEQAPRQLIWIPIIHTEADLGSMSAAIRQLQVRKVGKPKWERRLQTVEQMWQRLGAEIEGLGLDYAKVRLYQDGLPCSAHEADIVRDLAQGGSLNHRLLLDLIRRGAQLTGTEAPELLLEEYELARQVVASLGSGQSAPPRAQEEMGRGLLERRDRYIAEPLPKRCKSGKPG